MKRRLPLLLVALLLMFPGVGSANPNGVGSGDFDFQCGGACHGDANMNITSPANVTIVGADIAYEGMFTSITVHVSDAVSTPSGLLGVFLLSDLSGVGDEPSDDGWTIVTNSEGTVTNYVEVQLENGANATSVTWTVRAPGVGEHTLYAALHHGEGNQDAPFFGQSQGHTVTVMPVPENLPQPDPTFAPPSQRNLGTSTVLTVPTLNVMNLTAEWRDETGRTSSAEVQPLAQNEWSVTLPASLAPNTVEWRLVLTGEGPNQTTPWFQLTSQEPPLDLNEWQIYLQATALGLFCAAFVITAQRRPPAEDEDPLKEVDYDSLEEMEVKF